MTSGLSTSRVRRGAFSLAALAFVALGLVLLGPFLAFPAIVWTVPPAEFEGHLVHDVALSMMLLGAMAGVAIQLYRPAKRLAAAVSAVAFVGLISLALLAGEEFFPPILAFVALALIVLALHPAGLGAFRGGRIDRRLAALVGVAAVPLALYAVGQLTLQFSAGDTHAAIGHWAGMAAFAVSVLAVGLVAATDLPGARFSLWAVGLMTAYFGAVSLAFATQPSTVPTLWAGLAIFWAVAFVAVGEFDRREATRLGTVDAVEPTVVP